MIPTIEDIIRDLKNGVMSNAEALGYMETHLKLAAEVACDNADLRDYFAGKAMQAAATNPSGADGFTFAERAKWAYEQADAMLEARQE